jgi:prolyl-tRNA synthetase
VAGSVMLARRTGGKKESLAVGGLPQRILAEMDRMQRELLETARDRREANSIRGVSKGQFLEFMARDGGFAYGGFCGVAECEAEIKDQTKATIRVLPDEEFRSNPAPTTCMWCGRASASEAVWAKAY